MSYDPERHHRRSIRAKGHDYAGGGAYFVTMCAHGRTSLFGDVADGHMVLNDAGEIVREEWFRSATVRTGFWVVAGMVMPNHLHGVVVIEPEAVEDRIVASSDRAHSGAPQPEDPSPDGRRLHRPQRSLGSFVAMFKATTTRRVNELRGTTGEKLWQRDYYEHIVRSDDAMARIVNYILTNPLRWHLDADNPDRLADDDFDRWLGLDPTSHKSSPDGTQPR